MCLFLRGCFFTTTKTLTKQFNLKIKTNKQAEFLIHANYKF